VDAAAAAASASEAREEDDHQAGGYGKARQFQNPHVPLSGPVHCADDNLYNPTHPAEHAYETVANKSEGAYATWKRPPATGELAPQKGMYYEPALSGGGDAAYAKWEGPPSQAAGAGAGQRDLYYEPAFSASTDDGSEGCTTVPFAESAVHTSVGREQAEGILVSHGVHAGLYLLRIKTPGTGAFALSICTDVGKKKKAKFAHHMLEDSLRGFKFNGKAMATLCTTLESAVKCLQDNEGKGKLKVRPTTIVLPSNEFC